MNKNIAKNFIDLISDYLSIPRTIRDTLETLLVKDKAEPVLEYVIYRKQEIDGTAE